MQIPLNYSSSFNDSKNAYFSTLGNFFIIIKYYF